MHRALMLLGVVSLFDDARLDEAVCGSNCLTVAAAFLGKEPDPGTMKTLLPPEEAPYSLAQLRRSATELGLSTYLVKWNNGLRAQFDCPAILLVRAGPSSQSPDHFIVAFGKRDDTICIADFPGCPQLIPRDRLRKVWDGEVLYLDLAGGEVIRRMRVEYYTLQILRLVGWISVAAMLAFATIKLGATARDWKSRGLTVSLIRSGMRRLRGDVDGAGQGWPRFVLGATFMLIVTAGITWCLSRAGRARPQMPLISETQVVRIDPSKDTANKQTITFPLKNVSRRPVTIKRFVTSCTCLAVRELAEPCVLPGKTREVQVDVSVPEMGRVSQNLLVYIEGAPAPIELRVELAGRKTLPVLLRKVNPSPTFLELSDPSTTQHVTVVTREEIGSEPRLKELACKHQNVLISQHEFTEQVWQSLGVVERQYDFLTGWKELPLTAEFYGELFAKTNDPSKPTFFLGLVSGRLADPQPFSPKIVRLQPAVIEQETVVIHVDATADSWTFPPETNLPEWLSAEWQEVAGAPRLILNLRQGQAAEEREQFLLPIENSSGLRTNLEVVAYPAPSTKAHEP